MGTPAAAAASAISFVSAALFASGFSQYTGLPAASAASAISRCTSFGAVMSTTSTRGSATTSRQSALQRAKPRLRAAASAQAGLTSATISRTGTAGSGPNTMGTLRYATACALPIQPAPISPMRTSFTAALPQLAKPRPLAEHGRRDFAFIAGRL